MSIQEEKKVLLEVQEQKLESFLVEEGDEEPLGAAAFSEDGYMRLARRQPMLTAEEEDELFRLVQEKGCTDSEDRLVKAHLRQVLSIAQKRLGYGIAYMDLVQQGSLGLLKAIRYFDRTKGCRLNTYAAIYISAEINEYVLRNTRVMKTATTKSQRKLFFGLRSMKNQLRRGASAYPALTSTERKEIAQRMNVTEKDVLDMEIKFAETETSVNSPFGQQDRDKDNDLEIPDEGAAPDQVLEVRHREWLVAMGVQKALAQLSERSQAIVRARWIDVTDGGVGKTLHQLASEYKVSPERIRQIEVKAFADMRKVLSAVATVRVA